MFDGKVPFVVVKQRAFFLVSAAPVLVTAGDVQVVSWADALLAGFVLI